MAVLGTATPAERAILTLYANLMDEAKVRIDCIDRAVRGQTGFPAPIVREFCYGQLRFLCELIALSCLVAHGDIPATHSKRISRRHSANDIMEDLTKLRPHFYPLAVREDAAPIPGKIRSLNVLDPQPFSKDDLLQLYGKSHSRVHRGNVEKLLKSATPIDTDPDFPRIISWAQRINDQLGHHSMNVSSGGQKLLSCILRNRDDNNKVQTAFMEPQSPSP